MSDTLIVIGVLGSVAVFLLCGTVGYLGYQLSQMVSTVLKFNHKEDRDNRSLLERLVELARVPTHLTQDMAILHAQERNNQVVAETKADVVVTVDPVPESKMKQTLFTTDPDVRGHYS